MIRDRHQAAADRYGVQATRGATEAGWCLRCLSHRVRDDEALCPL